MLPWSTEPNTIKGGILVHTIVLFSGSCEAGKAAARTLHVKLLGDVRPLFYVPVPRARSLFGNVYMVTLGFPYLVRRTCCCCCGQGAHALAANVARPADHAKRAFQPPACMW